MPTLKIKAITIVFIVMLTIMGVSIIASNIVNINQVKHLEEDWAVFDRLSNERLNIYAGMLEDIGYGRAIHHFKNYIIRRSDRDYLNTTSSLGGLKSKIRSFKIAGLSASEQEALAIIEKTFRQYEVNLNRVKDLISQGMSSEKIDANVKVNDAPALQALEYLKNQLEGVNITPYPKSFHLTHIAQWWGYGGLIHHFKNYLLRGEAAYYDAAQNDIGNIKKIIAEYRHYELNTAETGALNIIELTLTSYAEKLDLIKMMKQKGVSIHAIDRVVQVSDYPANKALSTLYQQFLQQTKQRRADFYSSLNSAHQRGITMLIMGIVFWLLFVLLAVWLFAKTIYTPIIKMTQAMKSIANKQLETDIPYINNDNEIGQMANALAVFQENCHILLSQKQSLADSTVTLEQYNQRLEKAYDNLQKMHNELEAELASNKERRQKLTMKLSENLLQKSDMLKQNAQLTHQLVELNSQNQHLNDYMMRQLEGLNNARHEVFLTHY